MYEAVFRGLPVAADALVPRATVDALNVEPLVRALSSALAADLPSQLDAFRRAFPDFRCELPVYFLFAAGAFDGATRRIDDRPALLFGLDVVARVHGERLAPLVIHELFHVHHDVVVPDAPDRLYWALWKEGLATLVSRRLNPDVPEGQVCCLPDVTAAQRALPRLAAEVLARLDSERPEDYARYFFGGATDIPSRAGYYLGYLVAETASRDRSLSQLVRLSPGEVRTVVERTLAASR